MAEKRRNRKKNQKHSLLYAVIAAVIVVAALLIGAFSSEDNEASGQLTVHYIDVGQGDAILVQAPTGENMLIDAGPGTSEDALIAYLNNQEIETVDRLVLTHPDEDHIGGADAVLAEYTVSSVIMPDCEKDTKAYRNLMDAIADEGCGTELPQAGQTFSFCEGGEVTVLAPNAERYSDVNDYSVVLRFDYYDTSFLFTGDAGKESEAQMLSHWETLLDCDVLKVGHHGSYTATTKEFLEAVTPEIAVISCAEDNKYGHPHAEVTARLEKENIQILRTDTLGSICIRSDGKELVVE